MFVVHNGRVSVQISENGRPRTVATLSEGAFFGEMALFTGEPRTANIVAVEETEVLEIGHDAMKRVFDTNPDLVESLSHIIAERRQGLAASRGSTAPGRRRIRRPPVLYQALLRPEIVATRQPSITLSLRKSLDFAELFCALMPNLTGLRLKYYYSCTLTAQDRASVEEFARSMRREV